MLPFADGLANVTARWGDAYLSSVLDARAGAANGSVACPVGQAVTGLQVAVAPMREPPYSYVVTGLLVSCSGPTLAC